jgi:hypothetical protein
LKEIIEENTQIVKEMKKKTKNREKTKLNEMNINTITLGLDK